MKKNPPGKTVLLIVNRKKPRIQSLVRDIRDYLETWGYGVKIVGGEESPESIRGDEDCRFAVSLGGDGTVLFAARLIAEKNIPLIPVKFGTLGFITEFQKKEWRSALEAYLKGRLKCRERLLLDIEVIRGERVFRSYGFNDAVIAAKEGARVIHLEVSLSSVPLETYRADGIIVASPTGSTAYSLAAGGPIVHPFQKALLLTPICPFSLNPRPMVLPPEEEISVRILKKSRPEIGLTIDGQIFFPLEKDDLVVCRKAVRTVQVVHSPRYNFYEVVRKKLSWPRNVRNA